MEKILLIIGAGRFGQVIEDTAYATGLFSKVIYLDDDEQNVLAMGKCNRYANYKVCCRFAYPAFGNNELRMKWLNKLESHGYLLPQLIHPQAYISSKAVVEQGVVILPSAVVHTNAYIKTGALINIGALIDHDVIIGRGAYIGVGAIIRNMKNVPELENIDHGKTY